MTNRVHPAGLSASGHLRPQGRSRLATTGLSGISYNGDLETSFDQVLPCAEDLNLTPRSLLNYDKLSDALIAKARQVSVPLEQGNHDKRKISQDLFFIECVYRLKKTARNRIFCGIYFHPLLLVTKISNYSWNFFTLKSEQRIERNEEIKDKVNIFVFVFVWSPSCKGTLDVKISYPMII